MVNRLLFLGLAVILVAGSGAVMAQDPPPATTILIDSVYAPTSARIMGNPISLRVFASKPVDETRNLVYQWSIVQNPTTAAVLTRENTASPILEVWWAAQGSQAGLNENLRLRVEVSYEVPEEGEEPAFQEVDILLSGYNRAPVPVIGGTLGTPTQRIATGQAVQVDSYQSTDPDLDAFRSDWGFGPTRGGVYLGATSAPTFYATEGVAAAFTVPPMSANIDQDIVLQLSDGLYEVRAIGTAYLTPSTAPPPGTNTAPTITLAQTTVTVAQGGTATFQATANDAQSDTLAITWLFNSSTVNTQYVSTVRSGSSYISTLQYPTAGLSAGTYSVSVQAFETSTAGRFGSPIRFGTLIVNTSGGGGQPGFFQLDQQTCQLGGAGPSLVSIVPDPRVGEINVSTGQTAQLELVFQDTSTRVSPLGGTQTGISNLTWDLSQLTSRGIQASASQPLVMPDARQARATLSFQVPAGTSGEARVFATVTDVLDCPTTVGFGFLFPASSNAPPTARIRFDHDGDSQFSGPFATGHTAQTDNRSILLDAGQSTDDAGPGQLSYSWTAGGIAGATLSSPNGTQTTLNVPEGATGTVQVILTATDSGSLSATSTVNFVIAAEGTSPSARIVYDEDRDGDFTGPFSSGHIVQTNRRTIDLDGSQSTDDGGLENLTFAWSVEGIAGSSVNPPSGQTPQLIVPGGTTGSVTVLLTVTDGQSLSDGTSIVFNYTSAGDPPTAEITRTPQFATVGEEVEIEGLGESGGGTGRLTYTWQATCCGGEELELFMGGPRARVVAPELGPDEEEGLLTIEFIAYEDGMASEPVTAEIPIRRPNLYFAQLAVGNFLQGDEELNFETSIVLVNNSEIPVQGKMTFLNEEEGQDWTVTLDGEVVSESVFDLGPGAASEFVLTGEELSIGWMKLSANVKLTGHLFYRVVKPDEPSESARVVSEVPILPVSGRTFRTALAPGQNDNVALALVNVSDHPSKFRIRAIQPGGAELATSEVEMGSEEHMARFLNQVFEDSGLPPLWPGFRGGTLVIEVTDPDGLFVATILKTKSGLPLSILPVAVTK